MALPILLTRNDNKPVMQPKYDTMSVQVSLIYETPVYFHTPQIAQITGTSVPTVLRWIGSGELIAQRNPGERGQYRVLREHLVDFLNAHSMFVPPALFPESE